MAKYDYEFKKKIVNAYMNGEGGKQFLANKYGVKSSTNIMKWVNAFKSFGDEGLMRSRKNETYTFEFKLHVVELYLSTEVSYHAYSDTTWTVIPVPLGHWFRQHLDTASSSNWTPIPITFGHRFQ